MFEDQRARYVNVPETLKDSTALVTALAFEDFDSADELLNGMDLETARYAATYLAAKLRDILIEVATASGYSPLSALQGWAYEQAEFNADYEIKWNEYKKRLKEQGDEQ